MKVVLAGAFGHLGSDVIVGDASFAEYIKKCYEPAKQ